MKRFALLIICILFCGVLCGCSYTPNDVTCNPSTVAECNADLRSSAILERDAQPSAYCYALKNGTAMYYLVNLRFSEYEILRISVLVDHRFEFDTSNYQNPVNNVTLHGFTFCYTTLLTDSDAMVYESHGVLTTPNEVYYLHYSIEGADTSYFYNRVSEAIYAAP